jgi:hypothetical protein
MTNIATPAVALTLADMGTAEYKDCYSDMFKSLHGFRPRGEWCNTPEFMLQFFNDYDADIEAELERDRQEAAERLVYLNAKHGTAFTTLHEASRYNEQKAFDRFQKEEEAREAEAAAKVEMTRRFSPAPYIEAWEYGQAA